MKRTKRMVSLILTLLMIVSMIPLSTITSGAAGGVKKKLDSFITSYPSGSRWTGSFDGGSQCYGFGKMVVYNLFGKNSSGVYRSWTYAGVSTSGMNVIGSVTSFSSANVKSLLSKAKCGDILQFNTTKQHTMVVYSVDSGGVTVYDCNWDNNCGISKRYCSFGAWSGRNSSKLTLLRADNYDKIDGPAVSHTVDTKYGKNFTAYPKAKITAANIFDANHNQISSTAWIGTSDKCTILEVYTDGCCKLTYPLDGGGTKTVYSKISLFNTTHNHSYTTYAYYEAAHPHYNCYKCSCGAVQKRTSETRLLTSCAQCSEIAKYTLTASPSSLTMRVGETKSITIKESSQGFTVYMNGKYSTGKFTKVSFGDWVDNCKRTLTFTAAEAGEAKIIIELYSSLTDKMVKTITIPVTILPNTYTVTYNANGGTGAPSNQTKKYDTTLILSSKKPTKTGYLFTKWTSEPNGNGYQFAPGANYNYNQNMTLYAQYTPIQYTVKYNANGGTGTMANSTHTYDASKALTANGFTRTGYTFLGWSTSASATTATYKDKQSVKNLTSTNGGTVTLYAVWQKNPVTVSSIAVQTLPAKMTYTVGDKFDASGLAIRVTMSDGTVKTLTSGFTVSAPDMTTAGTKTVTVSYGGKTATFTITVKAPVVLSSISVQTLPTKTTYTVGDKFDASGLTIKATMSDGTVKTLTSSFTVSAPDMTTAGTKTVTVSYGGKTATFNITVKAPVPPVGTAALRLDVPVHAAVGQKIQIPVMLENASIGTLMFTVKYDATKLKYVSNAEPAFDMCDTNSATAGIFKAACIDNATVPAGKVIVLTFEVIAPDACSTNLVLTVEEAYDGKDNPVSMVGGAWEMQIVKSVPGDVNGDGRVTAIDARWVLQAASGARTLDNAQSIAADVNGDGKVSAIDARWILQVASGSRKL